MAASPPSPAPDSESEFLARVAAGLVHELKNPLSTLGLHLSLLREDWGGISGPEVRRSLRRLDQLQEEVQRLNEILEDFLLFARTGQIETRMESLNRLVEGVAAFVAPEARACKVELETFLDANLPDLPLDAGKIRQVLLNLLVNARQALEGRGGRVTVITRREGGEVLLDVLDDGPGMAPETLERCFEAYFSGKKNGSGLGLPMVRRILAAHHGSIEIQSAPEHGTRVRIRLPLFPPPGENPGS
ncbi:MAG: PAS domain-containing sensor histidine kinase [Planctomycetota bacterium]